MKLALFDLDGTITFRDTFVDFVRFTFGWKELVHGMIRLRSANAAFYFGVLNGTSLKEKYLDHFFKGWPKQRLEQYGRDYAVNVLPNIVKPDARKRIKWHEDRGHRVIVVTASINAWIDAWSIVNDLELISSRIEFRDGFVTGRLSTPNCNGREKVRRIKERVDISSYETIYAYGNSRGDIEMLALADEKHYRCFRSWPGRNLRAYILQAVGF